MFTLDAFMGWCATDIDSELKCFERFDLRMSSFLNNGEVGDNNELVTKISPGTETFSSYSRWGGGEVAKSEQGQ